MFKLPVIGINLRCRGQQFNETTDAETTSCTFNTAGPLIRVEAHDGTAYQLLAEMVYSGMGQRVQMTGWAEGLSLTTYYTLDLASGTSDLLQQTRMGMSLSTCMPAVGRLAR